MVGFLPIDVNHDALIRPHYIALEIHDENGIQKRAIRGYPLRKTFVWSPATGKGVVFKIEIGNLKLEKKYPGRLGFPEFLTVFNEGTCVFKAEEFQPEESKALKDYGVESVQVNFIIRGAEPVIKFLDQ